jgi:16S rRNA processing protein RimM
VAGPFGVRGEVKVVLETDFPERFEGLEAVWLSNAVGGRMVAIESARLHKGFALVKFAGCDDRETAEKLRGAELRIERSQLRELQPGEYYVDDILGLEVCTTDGRRLGQVTEVLKAPANDVYVTPKALIPALKQVVREVDLVHRKMIIEPVEGLLDSEG